MIRAGARTPGKCGMSPDKANEASASQLTVFNVQRMSTEDGPGLRTTVFVTGCSLECTWCHNPEGMSAKPQVVWHERNPYYFKVDTAGNQLPYIDKIRLELIPDNEMAIGESLELLASSDARQLLENLTDALYRRSRIRVEFLGGSSGDYIRRYRELERQIHELSENFGLEISLSGRPVL